MNTYLKIAVLCLCAVAVGLLTLILKTYVALRHVKPLVFGSTDRAAVT